MGERSQLIVTTHNKGIEVRRGRYYQWVWGEHLTTRVRQVIDLLTTWSSSSPLVTRYERAAATADAIVATYNINRKTGDVQGFNSADVIDEQTADEQHTNHGIVLVDYDNDTGAWTVGHIDRTADRTGWRLTGGSPFKVGPEHVMDRATAERIARTPITE